MFERLQEKRNEGGFTLIELLIVIIILAILAAIVVFAVGTTSKNSAVASCNADAKSVETAVEAYKAQIGSWPADINALTTTQPDGATPSITDGPWLRQVPRATVTSNGYQVTVGGSGVVDVITKNHVSPGLSYDGSPNPCDDAGA